MNGIENFLLRGREKRRERVRNGGAARRGEMRREKQKERKIVEKDGVRKRSKKERTRRYGLNERRRGKKRVKERRQQRDGGRNQGGCAGQQGATERAKIFWHFMSVIT